MNSYNSININMLSFLSRSTPGSNPFIFSPNKSQTNFKYPKPDSIIYRKEVFVRCPICLAVVLSPIRPRGCFHIFCLYCLCKWMKQSTKCPLCKGEIDSLIKVNLNEKWVQEQGELYV